MAYLTEAYLQDAYGTSQVATLCPTADELSTTIELAEAEVEGALQAGGYTGTYPSSVYSDMTLVPKAIKLAAYGVWLELAHGRRGLPLPETLRPYPQRVEDLRLGRVVLAGATVDTTAAVGGVDFSVSNADTTTSNSSIPSIFSRSKMLGF